MHSAQSLEILADELGAASGRIERELRLKDEARAARFEARLAAIELAALKAEDQRDRHFNGILDLLEAKVNACIAKVKDGEPGKDGKDADIEPLRDELEQWEIEQGKAFFGLEKRIAERLAEVKDGRDGEPGKDADIGLVREEMVQAWEELKKDAEDKVMSVLDSVRNGKDGKDGEPGRDADIGPLIAEIKDVKEHVLEDLRTTKEAVFESVDSRLDELKDGKDGKDGEAGPPGKDGKDGKLPIAREWTNRVHYEGDVVRYAGATYQALADTGREPPHSDWGELASRGTDGLGFVLRGTYDASAEYKQHDIVMINRNSFAAKYDSPGECPGDGWVLFGPSGQRGKEGPPGQRGEPGKDGRSISVTKWEADPDEMVLRVTDSSGDVFVIDLQPIAERIVEAAR